MFRLIHRDGNYEFFVYAPLTRGEGPIPPFRGAPARMCTVYYFWWSFLRLNQGYLACCERGGRGPLSPLYEDFGDVRDDDFLTWWRRRGVHCFAEPPRTDPVFRVKDLKSLRGIAEGTVLISISLEINQEEAISKVRELISESRTDGFRGSVRRSFALYPVHDGNPNLPSLYKILRVKQAQLELPRNATRYEIGKAAGLDPRGEGSNDPEARAAVSNTVTKNLVKADCLIHNVAFGRFPDYSKSNSMAGK